MPRPSFDELFQDANIKLAIQEEINRQVQIAIEEYKSQTEQPQPQV